MNKLIICDLDGTIADSRIDLANTINSVRNDYGLPPLSVDTVTGYIGNGSKILLERSLKEIDVDIAEAFGAMQKYYNENVMCKTTLYPTVENGIKLLREHGYKTAIATNKPQNSAEALIDKLNFSKYFDVILGGSSDYELKPDPAMLNIALKRTDSDPAQSWMIGDNYTDLAAGRRAGIKKCFALYGFGNRNEEQYDIAVSTFAEFAKEVLF